MDRYLGCPYGRPFKKQDAPHRRARRALWALLPDTAKALLIDARTTTRARHRARKLQRGYNHIAQTILDRRAAMSTPDL